jgi:hypothetical protein
LPQEIVEREIGSIVPALKVKTSWLL